MYFYFEKLRAAQRFQFDTYMYIVYYQGKSFICSLYPIFRSALQISEGIALERESLVKQLDVLR